MPSTVGLFVCNSLLQFPLNADSLERMRLSEHSVCAHSDARDVVTSALVTVKDDPATCDGAKRARVVMRGAVQFMRVVSPLRFWRNDWQVEEMVTGMRGLVPLLTSGIAAAVGRARQRQFLTKDVGCTEASSTPF